MPKTPQMTTEQHILCQRILGNEKGWQLLEKTMRKYHPEAFGAAQKIVDKFTHQNAKKR